LNLRRRLLHQYLLGAARALAAVTESHLHKLVYRHGAQAKRLQELCGGGFGDIADVLEGDDEARGVEARRIVAAGLALARLQAAELRFVGLHALERVGELRFEVMNLELVRLDNPREPAYRVGRKVVSCEYFC